MFICRECRGACEMPGACEYCRREKHASPAKLGKSLTTIGTEIGHLVEDKNAAYGNAFMDGAKVMAILYPNGISVNQMQDALLVIRIIDKLFRLANRKDAFGESPFQDIAGYGICGTWAEQSCEK